MKIGIIADTHDNLPLIKKCIEFMSSEKIDLLIHAGDFVAPFALKALKTLSCKKIAVFGNNDGEKTGLSSMIKDMEGEIFNPPHILLVDNKKIIITHNPDSIDIALLKKEKPQIVIYGHTHSPEIKKEDGILYINPGEASGWLSNISTVAILETETLSCRIEKIYCFA